MKSRMARKQNGSQIAEFGPALIVFCLLILFPLINFVYLGVAYGTAWYINHSIVRELALTNPKNTKAVADTEARVSEEWAAMGLAHFIGINEGNYSDRIVHSKLTYFPDLEPEFISITTDVKIKPFINIPAFPDVPGVGKDMVFSFSEQQPLEEKGLD